MRIKKIRLAHLTDISTDEIVEAHVKYVTNPKYEFDEDNSYIEETEDGKYPHWVVNVKVIEEGRKAPRKAILALKYMFLLHVLITRCRASKHGSTRLHYDTLVSIVGKVLGDMLRNLHLMGIIHLSDTYEIGVSSRTIDLLDWNIGFDEEYKNRVVIDYINKLETIEKRKRKKIKKDIESTDNSFIKRYNDNLNRIEIRDYVGALDYINSQTFENEQSHQYYLSRIEDFDNQYKNITRIDDRGRIYHFLTNCPRSLKPYFNIRYQLDIANSQPLLFCFFLMDQYKIDDNIIRYMREIIDNKEIDIGYSNNHNDCKQLCKLLKDNGLQGQKLKDIPSDVLLYIYKCMKGEFWDDFVNTFHELDRGEVKEDMFREVFYAYSLTMRNKEYGKVFAKVYPSVWKVIRGMRKDAELLCHRITRTESELFHHILEKCFERGWVVVSIHDAILVLDVAENDSLSVEDVKSVMLDVYREKGMIPTISVDSYRGKYEAH